LKTNWNWFLRCDRTEWRRWLEANHRTAPGIWLVYYKVKSGISSVHYSEAVKEALCFGWIDSKVKSLDATRCKQIGQILFLPLKTKTHCCPDCQNCLTDVAFTPDLLIQKQCERHLRASVEIPQRLNGFSPIERHSPRCNLGAQFKCDD